MVQSNFFVTKHDKVIRTSETSY